MEKQIEKRALEMKKAIYADIGGKLKAPLAERERIHQLIASRKVQLEKYRDRATALEDSIATLDKEIGKLLADGEDPEKISEEMARLRSELEEVAKWIKLIEPHLLSLETKEISRAQADIQSALRASVVHFHEIYTADLNKKVRDFIETEILAWKRAHQDLTKELQIQPLAPHLQRLPIKNRVVNNNISS